MMGSGQRAEEAIEGWQTYWSKTVLPVPGWLNSWEGERLSALAHKQADQGAIVEIGCYRGRSTLCLAHGAGTSPGARIWSVDLFEDTYTFANCPSPLPSESAMRELLRRHSLENTVTLVRGDSRAAKTAAAVPLGISLLFVDGDHVYDSLAAEWNVWNQKLAAGAVVVFHDYDNAAVGDGVTRFCDEVIRPQCEDIVICDRFKSQPDAIPGGLFIAQRRNIGLPSTDLPFARH